MIRAFLRGLGYLGLALGFIAFVDDGARYVANNEWSFLAIGSAIDAVLPRAYAGWERPPSSNFQASFGTRY